MCLGFTSLGFFAKSVIDNATLATALHEYGIWIVAFAVASLIALGMVFLIAFALIRYRVKKLLKSDASMSEIDIVTGLVDFVTSPVGVENPTPAERQRAAIVNFGSWLMRREGMQFYLSVTIAVMGGLIGSATLFLLYEQNQKIDEQNRRITLQTDANVTQSVLLESARRSSNVQELNALLVDISNTMESISKDCHDDTDVACIRRQTASNNGRLLIPTENLDRRIKSFVARSTPYFTVTPKDRQVDFDQRLKSQLELPYLSPERGRLFEELVRREFKIEDIDFSYSSLNRVNLPAAKLSYADLNWASFKYSELPKSRLNDANFRQTNLTGANFKGSFAQKTRFDGSIMVGADLSDSKLSAALFTAGDLRDANFNSSIIMEGTFRRANLENADFRKANLMGADFREANLTGASFGWANISQTNFSGIEQSDINISAAWAWEDWQPVGLAPSIQYKICKYMVGEDRMSKPGDQSCRDKIIRP